MDSPAGPRDEDEQATASQPLPCWPGIEVTSASLVPAVAPLIAGVPAIAPVTAGRARIVPRMLLLADASAVAGTFLVHYLLYGRYAVVNPLILIPIAILLTTGVANLHGLYGRDIADADHTTTDELEAIFQTVTLVTWLLLAVLLASGAGLRDSQGLLLQWGTGMLLVPCARTAARAVIHRRTTYEQRTVIVGAGTVGQMMAEKIIRNRRTGMRLVGFIDGSPLTLSDPVAHIPVLGSLDHLQAAVRDNAVERVLIAFSGDALAETLAVIRTLGQSVQIDIVPRLFEAVGPTVRLHALEGVPLVGLSPRPRSYVARPAKRLFDLVLGTLLLVAIAPVLAILAVLVKLDSPGPVLYRSVRVGENGRRFELCKFRSMRLEVSRGARYGGTGAEEHFTKLMHSGEMKDEFERTHKLRNDPRMTRFGAWLRKTSLDELPQLFNVVMGTLSIVGPRPITAEEFDQFFADETHVVEPAAEVVSLLDAGRVPGYWELEGVLPGITGYWQITGRSAVGYEERLRLDWAYVYSCSLKLDVLILAKTIRALGGRDAF